MEHGVQFPNHVMHGSRGPFKRVQATQQGYYIGSTYTFPLPPHLAQVEDMTGSCPLLIDRDPRFSLLTPVVTHVFL